LTDHAAIRANLAARLTALESRSQRLETELLEPLSQDFEEQATEKEDDEALEAEGVMVIREIKSVRAAIGRIDAGNYGTCLSCGEAISTARLNALPEATLCVECMQLEHR
jgi:RNA polymerase-binding transcription factor DksA